MFLKEGFATYFEYHSADRVQPNWGITQQFVVEQLQVALNVDSNTNTLPLSYDVNNNLNDYSDVSQNKGASILRMVHHFLTLDNFKLGVSDYVNNNALSLVTPDILWNSFQPYVSDLSLPADMATIMGTWTTKSAYPLLTVTVSGNDVVITQENFAGSDGTQWYVPITYTTSDYLVNFVKTNTQAWLRPGEILTLSGVLENADWIILNNQQVGYYRVNYDDQLLSRISTSLNGYLEAIDEMSRAQIVDDQFNLAKAGKKDYNEVFNFLTYLKKELSYYPWYAASNGFQYLLTRIENTDVRNALKKYIWEQIQALYESLPTEQANPDRQIYTLTHVLAHTWACNIGNDNCIVTATEEFLKHTTNQNEKVSPNRRSIVYCNGLRNSSNILEDFTFLWNEYLTTNVRTEKITILEALGCANDSPTRLRYLSMVLSEPEINQLDAKYVFASVYSNSPEGVTDVLDFVIDKYEELTERFGGTSVVVYLISTLTDLVNSQIQVDKLQKFSETSALHQDIRNASVKALSTATQNLVVTKSLETMLMAHFNNTSTSISSHSFTNLLCLLMVYVALNLY